MNWPQRAMPASVSQINAQVKSVNRELDAMSKYKLFQGDCLDRLASMEPVKCIFADPPDNQDLGYGEYKDKMPTAEYVALLDAWINTFINKAEIVWLSFNARWTVDVGHILGRSIAFRNKTRQNHPEADNPEIEVKPCVQVFTFGQHNKHDFGNNHRPLWRINRVGAQFYPDAVKVPSWRQRNGDKRAAPGGRVPGDVFDMQYPASRKGLTDDYVKTAMEQMIWPGDVFDFPRVTGNSKQRCDWHPTQLHEELVKRTILFSTGDNDQVIDPFGGTGTTLRVCREIGRACTLIELDHGYCKEIAKANGLKLLTHDPSGRGKTWAGSKDSQNVCAV